MRYYSRTIVKTSIIFIALSLTFSYILASESATIWTTDVYENLKTDFAPGEIVYIHGQGFISNFNVDIDVTRPDSVIESGFETTDNFGEFVYEYDLNGIEGLYTVDASDGTNSAQTTFTDAAVWTTDGIAQQKNSFSCNEVVGLDGDGLTASTTLNYEICNTTGTCSPGNVVKSGTVDTDSNGDIVFKIIWTVPQFYTYDGQHKVHVYDTQSKTKTFSVTCGCADNDGDGYYGYDPDDCPTGDDCDDTDPNVNPGATEVCNNLIDDDCDDYIDCDDPDCASDPNCAVCGNGIVEGTEQCDPGVNDPNDCCDANCMFESNAYTCRPSTGICDVAEQCTGSSADCPSDAKSTDMCRAAVDQCDVDDYCDGINNDCPADAKAPVSTSCDDGLFCSATDHCDGNGNCVQLAARDCSAYDDQCNEGLCDENLDTCYASPTNEGQSCDDGLYCNVGETCQSGSCTGGSARDCSDSNECTDDICNEDLDQCENPNLPQGTECGLARDCPDDACNGFFAEFYPDDGNDYCDGSGNCIVYLCDLENSYCTDDDAGDGVNDLTCGAECDQDEDCPQLTEKCDYVNREYCTRDGYGICDGSCECVYDEWSCGEPDDETYCLNCAHCGDGVVNCGEECDPPGQQGERCLPEGAVIYYCLDSTSYEDPEYDTCNETCQWGNCEKIVTPDDPRCVPLPLPTCGWGNLAQCFSFNKPSFNFETPSFNFERPSFNYEKPSFEFNKPSFNFPTFDFSSFRR